MSEYDFTSCLFFSFTEKTVIAQPIFVFEKREQTFKVSSSNCSLFEFYFDKENCISKS